MFYKWSFRKIISEIIADAEKRPNDERINDILRALEIEPREGRITSDLVGRLCSELTAGGVLFPWKEYFSEATLCYLEHLDFAAIATSAMSLEALVTETILKQEGALEKKTDRGVTTYKINAINDMNDKTMTLGKKIRRVRANKDIKQKMSESNSIRNCYVHNPDKLLGLYFVEADKKKNGSASFDPIDKTQEHALKSIENLIAAIAYFEENSQ